MLKLMDKKIFIILRSFFSYLHLCITIKNKKKGHIKIIFTSISMLPNNIGYLKTKFSYLSTILMLWAFKGTGM